jgi:hypothetical protein
MIKNKGVYTSKCPACSRSIVMHVLADGSSSPNKCPDCDLWFAGIDNGEDRNTYVLVARTSQPNTEAEQGK